MAANTDPIFGLVGNTIPTFIAAANTATDGSGALVTIVTAGANGTRVDKVEARNAQITPAASSAMLIKLFLTDTSGNNPQPVGEFTMPAVTRSNTVIGATNAFTFLTPLIMKTGQILKACQSVYAGVQDRNAIYAYGLDY